MSCLAPYLTYNLLLVFVEIVGVYLLEIFKVLEQFGRVDKMAVDVIEIVEYHIAPEDKAVEIFQLLRAVATFKH